MACFNLMVKKDGGNPIEMRFTTDGNIGWETITLDFNDAKNGHPNGDAPVVYGQYATVNVFSNFGDTGSSTYYIDAIRGAANGAAVGSDSGTDPDPDTDPDPGTGLIAAPTPNKAPADVISVYSDAYTSIATTLNPDWGQQTKLLKSKSTETIPWNTPTSTTKDWNTHKQMFQPWNMCIWITRPMTLPRLIFF